MYILANIIFKFSIFLKFCVMFTIKTKMHSSRMLTVRCSGRRGGCIQACTRGGFVSQHALGRVSALGGVYLGCNCPAGWLSRGCLPHPPLCEQNDWQTPVKILPCRNYVADGDKELCDAYCSCMCERMTALCVPCNHEVHCNCIGCTYNW